MSAKLTKKQLAVLNYLEDFIAENGIAPTYREIQAELGLSSVSAVAEHIDNLVAKGVLRRTEGVARSLEVLEWRHEDAVNLFNERIAAVSAEEQKILRKAADLLGLDLDKTG